LNEHIIALLGPETLRPPAAEECLNHLVDVFGEDLPEDYSGFLRFSNGIEGPVGNGYLVIWPCEELFQANQDYHISEFAPGLVLIGGDGGNTAYGIDCRSTDRDARRYLETDLVGIGWDAVFFRCSSLEELIEHVSNP
jgi:hypothetical protein